MSKKSTEEIGVVCRCCKHEKALPFGTKCKHCNPSSRNNYERKPVKLKTLKKIEEQQKTAEKAPAEVQ